MDIWSLVRFLAMSKFLFVVCFFCFLAIYYLYNDNIYQKEQKAFYCSNNELLIKKIREVYDDKMETDSTNRELREIIARDKASQCFLDICDSNTLKEFTEFCRGYGFEPEELCDNSAARTCIDICEVQKFIRENPYKPTNVVRQKKLFSLG